MANVVTDPHQRSEINSVWTEFVDCGVIYPTTQSSIPIADDNVINVPPTLTWLATELFEMANLPVGWNSYGGIAVTFKAVAEVIRLLGSVGWDEPRPTVSPMARGGVHLEWGSDDDSVEINVASDGVTTALIDVNGEMQELSITNAQDPNLQGVLTWAYKLG